MNERVKKLWIEALTSGEYEQGKGVLRDGDTFCCLGVLCDLHRKEVGGEWELLFETSRFYYHQTDSILPETVAAWAGLPHLNPTVAVPFRDSEIGLSYFNDKGTPFPEIAKLIEANL